MLRTLRLSLRFIIPLALTLAAFAYAIVPLVDGLMLKWAIRDLDSRSELVAQTLEEPAADLITQGSATRLRVLLERATRDQRVFAAGVCNTDNRLIAKTDGYPDSVQCKVNVDSDMSELELPSALHVTVRKISGVDGELGRFILINDTSYVSGRSKETRRYIIFMFMGLGVIVALITVLVAHLSWRGWVEGVRAFLRGDGLLRPFEKTDPDIQPLVGDLRKLLREVHEDRRILTDTTIEWKPETLRLLLREHLFGDEVIVVSNREPYIHQKDEGGNVTVNRPASGLVTAVEPVMRACSGTWIAHGSGNADRETVDDKAHVRVPPENPSYTLRRLWLSEEEEKGFYYGFANEGLWPLCHIAHVRPIFRGADWEQYVKVNRRFADAVVQEARTKDPVVLVQDYHFALLPKLIRERLPKATIITFWHIPWPNAESFGICPWSKEILEGLLGSTILGFHTPYHTQNFINTVDRSLEARISREESTVIHRGHRTTVQDYPISIHWPDEIPLEDAQRNAATTRAALLARHHLPEDQLLGIGVDRLDYTKGIPERFLAVERMLEKHQAMQGRFTLIQIAAPSRSSLEDYQAFERRVRSAAERINNRFGVAAGKAADPIVLLVETHGHESVMEHYRGCNVCVVTSLHDGMNLVAKEFIASRDDERGVLVLSRFAGAAGELPEALIVNPYHVDQTADAIYQAIVMNPAEQGERMRSLRSYVRDFNIYRWAGRMLLDAAQERHRQKTRDRIGRLTSARTPAEAKLMERIG
ncbi:trehalose-6-phosphate synthase [soil metagenome]